MVDGPLLCGRGKGRFARKGGGRSVKKGEMGSGGGVRIELLIPLVSIYVHSPFSLLPHPSYSKAFTVHTYLQDV